MQVHPRLSSKGRIVKLGFHRYGCGMQMRLADASSGMRFV